MLEALSKAKALADIDETSIGTNVVVPGFDREAWKELTYLMKISSALNADVERDQRVHLQFLRGVVYLGAVISYAGQQIFGKKEGK